MQKAARSTADTGSRGPSRKERVSQRAGSDRTPLIRHLFDVPLVPEEQVMNFVRRGNGPPLLLIHGLGGSWRSWSPLLHRLSRAREVIAIDLPGHGATPPGSDSGSFRGLTNSVQRFIDAEGFAGIDMAGSSMGARIVLELARRGGVGNVVALDPGGFWRGWERTFFRTTISASIALLRIIHPTLPVLCRNTAFRTALLAQLSARPWALSGAIVANELQSFVGTPVFDALVRDLSAGPEQKGPAAEPARRVVIGWGRQDRLCLPRQAFRALEAFPSAELRWFDRCGHFPMWDQPAETIAMILAATEHSVAS